MQPAQRRRLAHARLSIAGQLSSSLHGRSKLGPAAPEHAQPRIDCWARRPSPPRHGVPTAVLSEDQLEQWGRDGFLLVSGLLSEEVAEQAERTMWKLCGLDPAAPPDTWLE